MKQSSIVWGTLEDATPIYLYTLRNQRGLILEVTNYGARIRSLQVPDKHQQLRQVILGYNTLSDYQKDVAGMGAVIGRSSNRIKGGSCSINNKTYSLEKNEWEQNNLHTGTYGFQHQVWECIPDLSNHQTLTLFLEMPHLKDGFPGTLKTTLTYHLSDDNELIITYEGISDQTTIFNPTQHAYFNLAGHPTPNILHTHQLQVDATGYTPVDDKMIPTGEIAPLKDNLVLTHLDYPKSPLDHNFILNNDKCFHDIAATLYCPDSGIQMDVYTTMPAIQIYTANVLNISQPIGLNNCCYPPHSGICLETQFYPDSLRHTHFPSPLIGENVPSYSKTIYRFS